jgi:hypothetical protein
MQRNDAIPGRRNAERDAAQPIAGQPRGEAEDSGMEKPEGVPSRLTAREFQQPQRPAGRDEDVGQGERHASASSMGAKGEPMITNDEPPRGKRGMPNPKSDQIQQRGGTPDENT